MAEQAAESIGALLEEMGARFELVIEAVTGFGGRIDILRDEIFGQFAEVGSQIRFLSDQIAENRRGVVAARDDLGAEIVRIGESLGRARVEFRDAISTLQGAIADELARTPEEISSGTKVIRKDIDSAADGSTRKLTAELSKTHKAIEKLAQKFERFDDRITVATRDQDQRIRKLERRRAT
jgi:hypothetical protein